jgi:cytochrome b561
MIKNTLSTYGSFSKFLHWVIAILVIVMLSFGFFLDDVPKEYQEFTYNLHKLTGLTILALMLIRLLWALMNVKPLLPAGTKAWERIAEHLGHFALYLFLICMPLVGWIGSIAAGYAPKLGSIEFNLPIEKNKVLSETAFDLHNTFAIILIVLVSIHILAALFHHFIKRDGVLRRMLPSNRE